jgi:Mn2+/Fe2+ NRAMP family transporter
VLLLVMMMMPLAAAALTRTPPTTAPSFSVHHILASLFATLLPLIFAFSFQSCINHER